MHLVTGSGERRLGVGASCNASNLPCFRVENTRRSLHRRMVVPERLDRLATARHRTDASSVLLLLPSQSLSSWQPARQDASEWPRRGVIFVEAPPGEISMRQHGSLAVQKGASALPND